MELVERRMESRIKYSERVMERLKRSIESGEKEVPIADKDVSCERKFCVGIVGTEVRLEYNYLLAAVGSLRGLGGVGADCRTDKLFVQVRGTPSEEESTTETLLSHEHRDIQMMIDAGLEFSYYTPPLDQGEGYYNKEGKKVYAPSTSLDAQKRWFGDETEDYQKALEKCLDESDADYIVIVEEDVWATEHFMDKLDGVVNGIEGQQWSMLKLFVTDYWQNWERERSDVILLALGGILFACIAEVIVRYCERRFGFCAEPSLKKRSSMSSLGVQLEVERGMRNKNGQRWDWWRRIRWKRWALRAYFVSLGIVTMYVVSKQALGLSEVSKKGVYRNDMGASSLGMAYPRAEAEDVVEWLAKPGKEPLDVRLMKFVAEKKRRQYVVVPCLLEHTGMFSSSARKQKFKNTLNEEIFYRDHMKLASHFDDVPLDTLWGMEPI